MELLAPAGNLSSFYSAVDAGADGVYLGFTDLNARRGAGNFTPDNLSTVVKYAHSHDAKVYLTLNIDIAQRELGLAARQLQWAAENDIDAVLVKDPALLALIPYFPDLSFHFSTQAAVSASPGMEMARELGIERVVLARELSLAEIKSASAVNDVETEAFVQGALCFCVSGRCMLSSWGGGRSGNRGTCTSPCRVPWNIGKDDSEHIMSMHDLCGISLLKELDEAGVDCLKIEGRLKKASWVKQAVEIYKSALAGKDVDKDKILSLGDYTGRKMTPAHLVGCQNITGESGRVASAKNDNKDYEISKNSVEITVTPDEKNAVNWKIVTLDNVFEYRTARQNVVKASRALNMNKAIERLKEAFPTSCEVKIGELPDLLLPKNAVNKVVKDFQKDIRQLNKKSDGRVRCSLSREVEQVISPSAPCAENKYTLGTKLNCVRLDAADVVRFKQEYADVTIVAENSTLLDLDSYPVDTIVALPYVIYEKEVSIWQVLITKAVALNLKVEVNSWETMYMARKAGAKMVAGPGLMVLNIAAAEFLCKLGVESVTISIEADQEKMGDICEVASVPVNIVCYGRPVLMSSRAKSCTDVENLEDSRGIKLKTSQVGEVTQFRSMEPFSLLGVQNNTIKAAVFTADLVASLDPVKEWQNINNNCEVDFSFNYSRTLK